jgi:hypothetical protein
MKRLFLLLALLIFLPLSDSNAIALPKPDADASASQQTAVAGGMISVTAKADTVTPYQNQPVLYTIRVIVRTSISGASVSNIDIANAIVEGKGAPDVSDEIDRGIPVRVAEFHYIITPLQPGKMTIPPVVLQGKFQAPNLAALADPSGSFAVSSGTQQSMNFFSTYGGEPFSIASNATLLNVKPPAAAMDPWLPLTSLKISEKIDASQSIHVGEPLIRKITLSATGAVGSQLPDLASQQQHGNFRVYADRPTMGENIDRKTGVISGWRTDSYSVIAQSAGRLVLPAIRISWWDVVNNKAAIAELPERIVNILPVVSAQKLSINDDGSKSRRQVGKSPQIQSHWLQNWLADAGYAILCGLVGVVIAALLFGAFRWWEATHKVFRHGPTTLAVMKAKLRPQNPTSRMLSGETLEHVHTAEELKAFLQTYAYRHWGTPKNASLEKIFSISPGSRVKRERDDVEVVTKEIGAALYAGRTVDVADLKRRSRRVIKALRRGAKSARRIREELPRLNPS